MSQFNRPVPSPHTHEGARTTNPLTPIQQLRRTLLTCMLWEDTFYESGVSVADRLKSLVRACDPEEVSRLAIEARTTHRLRHVPLLLVRELVRSARGRIVGDTIAQVIQRPDELAEFVALYWKDARKKDGKRAMLPKQVRIGLSRAFRKFDAYQLAKYDRDNPVRLRDVLFMAHAKPASVLGNWNTKHQRLAHNNGDEQPVLSEHEALYRDLVAGTLPVPDTWETKLSSGHDKGQTFETLLREKKLGYMALLRNIRNMEGAGVPEELITSALFEGAAKSKALPFRYIAAYRQTQSAEIKKALDWAMVTSAKGLPPLLGRTLVLIDVSGSMGAKLSAKSDLDRLDAAAALACYLYSVCEQVAFATFSDDCRGVKPEQGIRLVENIIKNQPHGGTNLGSAIRRCNEEAYDRIIVVTDEQSHDRVGGPRAGSKAYMINVAPYQNGVGYDQGWTKIDGFSEQVVNYIQAVEAQA